MAKALAESLRAHGLDTYPAAPDNHLMLVDLRPKGLKGNVSGKALVRAALDLHKIRHPGRSHENALRHSALRLARGNGTTRGFGQSPNPAGRR